MKENIVICINREYGSGGRAIGEMLSDDLGIHYYDKEILKLASEDSGINENLFVNADGKYKAASLFRGTSGAYNGELLSPDSSGFTSEQNLFNYTAKTIKDLADTQSCIIVGRCGGFILKDRPNVVRVFVYAPHDFRIEQAAKKKSLPPRELEKYVDRVNHHRAEYFHYYTGMEWYDARNYDLCIDSSRHGFEKSVEIIKGFIKVRFG